MTFHKQFWPWKEIDRLNSEIVKLRYDLEMEKLMHKGTAKDLDQHKQKAMTTEGHVRKLTAILAMKSGLLG